MNGDYDKVDLYTEESCVEFCLKFQHCIGVTLVMPYPELYDSSSHGCHLKTSSWIEETGAKTAMMVSVDVARIRSKCELFFLGDTQCRILGIGPQIFGEGPHHATA